MPTDRTPEELAAWARGLVDALDAAFDGDEGDEDERLDDLHDAAPDLAAAVVKLAEDNARLDAEVKRLREALEEIASTNDRDASWNVIATMALSALEGE